MHIVWISEQENFVQILARFWIDQGLRRRRMHWLIVKGGIFLQCDCKLVRSPAHELWKQTNRKRQHFSWNNLCGGGANSPGDLVTEQRLPPFLPQSYFYFLSLYFIFFFHFSLYVPRHAEVKIESDVVTWRREIDGTNNTHDFWNWKKKWTKEKLGPYIKQLMTSTTSSVMLRTRLLANYHDLCATWCVDSWNSASPSWRYGFLPISARNWCSFIFKVKWLEMC
jgi:hypothetical protein